MGCIGDPRQLKGAVQHMHGGTATLAESVPVRETFKGKTVWEGVVHVLDLTGHPTATRAYAWSSPIAGGTKQRFFAVFADRHGRRAAEQPCMSAQHPVDSDAVIG